MSNEAETTAGENEKRSISAPPALFDAVEQVMAKRHMSNFSEYVRDLIRRDIEQQGSHHPQPMEKAA